MRHHSMLTKLVVATMIVCFQFGVMQNSSDAQGRTLSKQEIDAIVTTNLEQCQPPKATALQSGRLDPSTIIPTANAREFPAARIAKTLHGLWRGRVLGDDKHVGVDYFWIIDTQRNEALIVAQRTGRESMAELTPLPNGPKLTYLMCAHEGYFPSKDTPQVHEFTKVSNDLTLATKVLQTATGVRFTQANPTLAEVWSHLVTTEYFNTLHGVAYAGGFFKPLAIQRVPSDFGPAQVSLKWDGEYRGGGSTSLKFTRGTPIKGVEHAQFLGTTASTGDYLVASPGNGKLWKVEAISGATYDLAFDSVVLGPLQQ